MKTFDYFSDYVKRVLSIPSFTTHDINFTLQSISSKSTYDKSDIEFDDATNLTFTLPEFPVKDGSIVFYRSATLDNIRDAANILTYEEYDSENGPITPTENYAIDFAFGDVILRDAFDPDTEYLLITYKSVNEDDFTNKLLETLAIADPVTKEDRENVLIEKKAYSALLQERRQSAASAGLGEIQVITLTRQAYGETFGTDPDTGAVVP